jgi:hypothetical protein
MRLTTSILVGVAIWYSINAIGMALAAMVALAIFIYFPGDSNVK